MLTSTEIGNQIWMKENLNVAHYRNGDPIPEVKDQIEWLTLKTGAWCYYKNDPENGKKYGKLYNWYAVNDPRGLAPEGWHIPTIAELRTLVEEVNQDGNALKARGQGSKNGVGTNASGFSAVLGGGRYHDNGNFIFLDFDTFFWSSSEFDGLLPNSAYGMIIYYDGNTITFGADKKSGGYSIRCLKNN